MDSGQINYVFCYKCSAMINLVDRDIAAHSCLAEVTTVKNEVISPSASIERGSLSPEGAFHAYVENKRKRSFLPKENKPNKQKCDPDKWKRRKAAIARDKGETYFSYKNKIMPKKEHKEGTLCRKKCRLKCSERFSLDTRVTILKQFYQLDGNAKNALIFKCITRKDTGRPRKDAKKHKTSSYKYFITENGKHEQVCKEALCALYQIGKKKVDIIKLSVDSGASAPPPDQRGRHSNRPHKINDNVRKHIIAHISKFPVLESQSSTNRSYLSPFLNLSLMYQLYIEDCQEQQLPQEYFIKLCSYSKIFSTEFNLSFGHPKHDKCSTCDSGQPSNDHIENYTAANAALKTDRQRAKTTDNIVFITMNLIQTMPLPRITTSKAFYLKTLWFYNLGIHFTTKSVDEAAFCTWTEDVANRGSSETCSSLLRFVEECESLQEENHLIIWSASCADQYKNFLMICLYQYLILKGYFDRIDHKFPEVGHTYLDSDKDFGRIEEVLRRHDTIYVPEQYREVILKASRNNNVIDMEAHFMKISDLPDKLKLVNIKINELNETVNLRDDIKWIRVEEYGSYLYKECYDETVPFKKVNILQNKKRTTPPDIEVERFLDKYGTISEEKLKDLEEQLKYVKNEYRYFYESIIYSNN